MRMSRPFAFPDPDDRSKNNPIVIVPSDQVLGLYNQAHKDEEDMQKVTDKVQDWFVEEAKTNQNWDDARFAGNQCILENQFKK